MYIRSAKSVLVLLLMVYTGSVLTAWAQSISTGTVAGSVTDPSGAVVGGGNDYSYRHLHQQFPNCHDQR